MMTEKTNTFGCDASGEDIYIYILYYYIYVTVPEATSHVPAKSWHIGHGHGPLTLGRGP